jgi:RNA polymerase sigma factor (sigma-70 family)
MIKRNKEELIRLLNGIKDQIFNLSARMLSDVQSAEDATQDIFLKIFNQIGTLKDKAKFKPWALTVAKNHLLNVVKEDARFQHISFDIMEHDCSISLSNSCLTDVADMEKDKMLAELKISCSQAMLMCLTKEERFIYILSSMFELNSIDGGTIMEISPDTYRQKLHRARTKLKNFLEKNCGLINKSATCQCRKRLDYAFSKGRISKDKLDFTAEKYIPGDMNIPAFIEMMENYEDYSDIFKQNPQYAMPEETRLSLLEKINKHFSN